MIDLTGPAQEVFQVLRSFDYTVVLYDDEGNRVTEPDEARRMFAKPENLLVSLVDDGDNSAIRLFIGKAAEITDIMGLVTSLRTTATKFNLVFNVRKFGKEIKPADFSSAQSVRESTGREKKMLVTEGMYGTSRSSYLRLENARMIVRHSAKIDPEKHGARSRHVENIFVENEQGERFLLPTTSLAAGRAMTQHVNNGGSFADVVGQQILRMAQEYASLAHASRHVWQNGARLSEAAHDVRDTCRCKMAEMRKVFERLYRPSGYPGESQRLSEMATALHEAGADGQSSPTPDPEKLDEMRSVLAVEGVELPDAVIEAAIGAMAERNDGKLLVDAAKTPAVPMISVLGRKVEAPAWEAFKTGSLDMNGAPDVENVGYTNRDAELAYKLGAIVPVVANHSLMTLLSFVADELGNPPTSMSVDTAAGSRALGSGDLAKRRSVMRVVASHAIKAAGLSLDESVAPTSAVREFADWMRETSPTAMLHAASDPGSDELSMEDVLLPPENAGADLERDVIDPEPENEEPYPDEELGRMKTLAGL